jgi:cell division protease FtsH
MAEKVIDEHRDGLVQLAELLLEREVVFTEDVENIFGKRKGKANDEVPKNEVTESADEAEAVAEA